MIHYLHPRKAKKSKSKKYKAPLLSPFHSFHEHEHDRPWHLVYQAVTHLLISLHESHVTLTTLPISLSHDFSMPYFCPYRIVHTRLHGICSVRFRESAVHEYPHSWRQPGEQSRYKWSDECCYVNRLWTLMIDCLSDWLTVWMTDWYSDWLIDWLTHWFTDRLLPHSPFLARLSWYFQFLLFKYLHHLCATNNFLFQHTDQ